MGLHLPPALISVEPLPRYTSAKTNRGVGVNVTNWVNNTPVDIIWSIASPQVLEGVHREDGQYKVLQAGVCSFSPLRTLEGGDSTIVHILVIHADQH